MHLMERYDEERRFQNSIGQVPELYVLGQYPLNSSQFFFYTVVGDTVSVKFPLDNLIYRYKLSGELLDIIELKTESLNETLLAFGAQGEFPINSSVRGFAQAADNPAVY